MKIQQGDVILRKLNKTIPEQSEKLNHLVLAEGETTGHKHRIIEGLATLYMFQRIMYLKVMSDKAVLYHEEHKQIVLEKGDYQVSQVREYDHFQEISRFIVD